MFHLIIKLFYQCKHQKFYVLRKFCILASMALVILKKSYSSKTLWKFFCLLKTLTYIQVSLISGVSIKTYS